jgi:hypothetical protein
MRIARSAAVMLIVTVTVLLVVRGFRGGTLLWAQQIGAPPPPLPPPPLPPGAPATPGVAPLGGVPPIGALPQLATPPPLRPAPLATPTATPRIFNCSCAGAASSPRWMGPVQASSYFQARQSAVNSCLAFNFNRRPGTAFVPPNIFHFFPTPGPPLAASEAEPGLPNLQAPGLSGFALLNSPRAIVLSFCSTCACD